MKKILVLAAMMILPLILCNCSDDSLKSPTQATSVDTQQASSADKSIADNPRPPFDIPTATVGVAPVTVTPSSTSTDTAATLTPSTLTATLRAGESITEHKVLDLPANVTPARGDVMFCMDLTGSMSGELSNAKTNSANIMNSVRGLISDTQFGLISHMDYPQTYSSCGYYNTYGDAGYGDYPYSLDHSLSQNIASVGTALSGLALGYGYDGPEDYTRALYETYADPAIGWRAGAKKFVVAWLDAMPHDCNYDACIGGTSTSGKDPGRDGAVDTADDLAILDVLNGMATNNITLLVLNSGGTGNGTLWTCYANMTAPGGAAFDINYDGTIPGGTDIGAYIASLIGDVTSHVDELTLDVCDPAYADWLVSVDPASYQDITLDIDQSFEFDIDIQVPAGTPDGVYEFDVCALGDGVEYARQHVSITVRSEIEVPLDIKPTSCPNPMEYSMVGNGILPVAILGTADFDVMDIDPATILLEGVTPVRWSYDDVATPFDPYQGKSDCMDCNTAGADGFQDLTLKFSRREMFEAIGIRPNRECVVLTITGQLYDGTDFVGEDVIRFQINNHKYPTALNGSGRQKLGK